MTSSLVFTMAREIRYLVGDDSHRIVQGVGTYEGLSFGLLSPWAGFN